MISKREVNIIKYLRENSRITLKALSKKTNIPMSTLFETLKNFKSIQRYTCLLDYKSLGYDLRVQLLIKTKNDSKELEHFLKLHPNINTLAEINNAWNYLVEAFFKNTEEYREFYNMLQHKTEKIQEIFILKEIKEQAFLCPGVFEK